MQLIILKKRPQGISFYVLVVFTEHRVLSAQALTLLKIQDCLCTPSAQYHLELDEAAAYRTMVLLCHSTHSPPHTPHHPREGHQSSSAVQVVFCYQFHSSNHYQQSWG